MKLKDAKLGDIVWFGGAEYLVQEDCKVILFAGFIGQKSIPTCEDKVIYKTNINKYMEDNK